MRIFCGRDKMAAAFQAAASVAPSRSPREILSNVKIEATEQGVELMATNMEIGIRIAVEDVEVEEGGSAILPLAQVGLILREFTAERLTITTDGDRLVITGGTAEITLQSPDPDEFPNVDAFAEEKYFQIAPPLLKNIIQRTLFATEQDNSRYALGGVRLETDGKKLFGVGTDGRRLSKMEGPAEMVGGYEPSTSMIIIPSSSMQMVERIMGEGEEPVRIAPSANDIRFSTPGRTIYARLLEGRFPEWRAALPKRESCVKIELVVGPFFAALRQAAIVADSNTKKLTFTFGEGNLVIAGQAAEVGQSHSEIPINYDGETISIALDHTFVSDILRVLDPQAVIIIEIVDADGAVLCRTEDGLEYVIMPLAND